MNKLALYGFLALTLTGCITTSGSYTVAGTQADGAAIPIPVMAQGSGIYSARNAICHVYPGATVNIIDSFTGEELKSESPYKCK